jgi:hypothetical protein
MNALTRVAVLAGAVLAVAGPARAWEGVKLTVTAPPAHPHVGTVWNATIEIRGPDGSLINTPVARPAVTLLKQTSARKLSVRAAQRPYRFVARPTSHGGRYTVRIVFPAAGLWKYRVEAVAGDLRAPTRTYPTIRVTARGV